MQNCTSATHRKFVKEPKKLLRTWVIRLNRLHGRDELCEVVAATRTTVTLMQVGRETRPVYILDRPPESFTVSLRGFLDPDGGFSYLGPRKRFAWIVPNATFRHKEREGGIRGQVTAITGPRVHISFVPPQFRARVRDFLAELPGVPHRDRFPTNRDLWIWEMARNYESASKVSAREWREAFAREHPTIDFTQPESREEDVQEPPQAAKPQEDGPRGLSVWQRITTPTTEEDS